MPNIKIHNDGKGKWQSYTATFGYEGIFDLHGYGMDRAEAVDELKKELERLKTSISELDLDNFILVDWNGKPLEDQKCQN